MSAKKYKSAVGIMTRNSERYIQEIICHNYLLGFDRIIIGLDYRTTDNTLSQIYALPPQVLDSVTSDCAMGGSRRFLFRIWFWRTHLPRFLWLALIFRSDYNVSVR